MDAITRLNASLSGRYSVLQEIGAGGMAIVYLAKDLRHDREVALKVLRPELGAILGGERFLAEIRVTANLQHPNLLPLFDSGEADGLLFYVMPFVKGESLRERLDREKQLPVDEAVRIAEGVARALQCAHREQILHRDLKPENILLSDGQPLVADFGIALAVSRAGGERVTQTGILLGTPQYMSPEQAAGERQIDARSDVFSLGCVLYEMLVGSPPHSAPTVQAVLSKLITEEPQPVTYSRKNVPAALASAIDRALAKLPADRFQSAEDLATALAASRVSPPAQRMSAHEARGWRRAGVAWGAFTLAASALVVLLFVVAARAPAAESPTRLHLLPPHERFGLRPSPAVSPDGRKVAFWAPDPEGVLHLWIRDLSSATATMLPGSAVGNEVTGSTASQPCWSPDGASLAFFANQKLKRADIAGGSPLNLADASNPRGCSWGRQDVIVFVPAPAAGLSRVSASGGVVTPLFPTPPGEIDVVEDFRPHFLPDGRHFLFVRREPIRRGIFLGTLDSTETRLILEESSRAEYADGFVFFGREGKLFAQPLDLAGMNVEGEPIRIVDRLGQSGWDIFNPAFSVASGTVVTWSGGSEVLTELAWYDRSGARLGRVGAPGPYVGFDLSPDERQVALEWVDPASARREIRLVDLGTGATSVFASGSDLTFLLPLWMPDGDQLLMVAASGARTLVLRSRAGVELRRIPIPTPLWFQSVSRDGTKVLFDGQGQQAQGNDIGVFDLVGEPQITPYLEGESDERQPRLSPDGRWVAYVSDETGTREVYVQSYPTPGHKQPVSQGGGAWPEWGPDGKALYYLSPDATLMAATVIARGPAIEFEVRALFRAPPAGSDGSRHQYAVTRDGRILFNERVASGGPQAIDVITNWRPLVRR